MVFQCYYIGYVLQLEFMLVQFDYLEREGMQCFIKKIFN